MTSNWRTLFRKKRAAWMFNIGFSRWQTLTTFKASLNYIKVHKNKTFSTYFNQIPVSVSPGKIVGYSLCVYLCLSVEVFSLASIGFTVYTAAEHQLQRSHNPTSAFTFKTLLRHYAKQALSPRSLNVKLGPRRNYHKGRAAIRHYANQPARPLWLLCLRPNYTST